MNKKEFTAFLLNICASVSGNNLPDTEQPIYDAPLIGFGSAADSLFEDFKKPEIIGPWHMSPAEWLGGAKTVVSLFFPFSEAVRAPHRKSCGDIPFEWLYARVEGQSLLDDIMRAAAKELSALGINSAVPAIDPRFKAMQGGKGGIIGVRRFKNRRVVLRLVGRQDGFIVHDGFRLGFAVPVAADGGV